MWGTLQLASPDASASGSTLTATQKEVESLVRGTSDSTQGPTVVPPVRPTSIDSSFYWVASLPSQVNQTLSPKFTPSPCQLLLKALINVYHALMKDQTRETYIRHMQPSNVIALILTDGREATPGILSTVMDLMTSLT